MYSSVQIQEMKKQEKRNETIGFILFCIVFAIVFFAFFYYGTSEKVWKSGEHDSRCEMMLQNVDECNCHNR